MENKKYQKVLIDQAKLQNQYYTYNDIQPCAYFWKELIKCKQTPFLMVPDTLILNDKENPLIWIYTNPKGMLQKSTNINLKDFITKITNYGSPNQLSAILKRVTYNDNYINGNQVKLLNSRYLQNASLQQLGGQGQMLITLQKYIKSNGNNAFICRSILRKNKNSQCFIITNKKSFYDQNQPQNKKFIVKIGSSRNQSSHSTIVKAIQGNHLNQTCKYLKSITDFMKLYRGIVISQLVGDFIKDQGGNWWLINIKAFKIQQKLIKNITSTGFKQALGKDQLKSKDLDQKDRVNQRYQKQKYQKTKICRYCQKSYLQSQLNHYMTIRMLIETDRYLLHLGKNYKWLKRSDIQNVDSYCLYQQHKICQRCYRLYMQIQSLMEVQYQFLNKLGFQMDKKPKQLLMDLTNQQQLKNQSKNKQLNNLANFYQQTIPQSYLAQQSQSYQMRQNENLPYRKQIQVEKSNQLSHQKNHLLFKQNNNFMQKEEQYQKQTFNSTNSFPKMIQLGPNSNIIFEQNVPVKNDQIINRMIRYRMILYLKQIDQIQLPGYLNDQQSHYNLFLQYELFGLKNKIKLDFNQNYNKKTKILSIKKLKINYFFSHSHQDVYEYLNSQPEDFLIKIVLEPKINRTILNDSSTLNKFQSQRKNVIGKLILPIKQYFNLMINSSTNKTTKKDFYKFFSVKQVAYGWGLEGSIGIVPSQSIVNTSRMIFFTKDSYIYLPNQNYYYCEYLPEQWVDVIKKNCLEKDMNSTNQNGLSRNKTFIKNKQLNSKQNNSTISHLKQNQIYDKIKDKTSNINTMTIKKCNDSTSNQTILNSQIGLIAQQQSLNNATINKSETRQPNVEQQKQNNVQSSYIKGLNTNQKQVSLNDNNRRKQILKQQILRYQKVNTLKEGSNSKSGFLKKSINMFK